MAEREKDQFQPEPEDKDAEITELDDKGLEEVSGGTTTGDSFEDGLSKGDNNNCFC